jgi:thiamine biosynthesis lipoprotein
VDDRFLEVLNRSIEIASETNGDFDPTVGPLVAIWGFGFEEVRGDVDSEMIEEIKSKTGYSNIEIEGNKVKIPEGFSLDFNALAQGYTVDVIAKYLESQDVKNYMVEVGGEIKTLGLNDKRTVWTIGVDKPQNEIDREDRFQFILELKDAGLATSGNYRKYWVDEETGTKYSHTIDPHTGTPALNRLLSASIITKNTMDADAYATVCMVKGLEDCKAFLESKPELEGYLVYTNDKDEWEVFITPGFEAYIKE